MRELNMLLDDVGVLSFTGRSESLRIGTMVNACLKSFFFFYSLLMLPLIKKD